MKKLVRKLEKQNVSGATPDPVVAMEPARKKKTKKKAQSPDAFGMALRALGGATSSYLMGNPALGTAGGAFVSRLLGHGDYEVKTNSLLAEGSPTMNSAAVVIGPDGRRGVRIQEREFIGTVYSTTTFTNKAYCINPGISSTFPWLSVIAQNFDEWKPNGMAFSFRSTSAAFNGSNQSLGVVIGATEYDPIDTPFSSRVEMESSAYAVSGVASADWVHLIECDPSERGRMVLKTNATQTVSTQASEMDYHLGVFQIATDGQSTAGQVLGELWVSYDITFFKKQLFGGQVGNAINAVSITGVSSGYNSGTAPLGTYTSWTAVGTMSMTALSNVLIQLNNISTGYYALELYTASSTQYTGSSGASVYPTITGAGSQNVVAINNVGTNPAYNRDTSNAGGAQTVSSTVAKCNFLVTGPNPIINIGTIAAYAGLTLTAVYLNIWQIPPPNAYIPQVIF